MLSHHFGSKAGLEAAIVKRATELLTVPLLAPEFSNEKSPRQQVMRVWEALSDPDLDPLLRLYFDLASRAANGSEIASTAVDAVREHWTRTALSIGLTDDTAEHVIGAAVTSTLLKGLLLDRLTGASLAEIELVLDRFIALIESYEPSSG